MKKLPKLGCACEKHDLSVSEYRTSIVGTDFTNDKNAEVSIIQCRLCQRIWLNYAVEFPDSQESGRWFKGIIAKKETRKRNRISGKPSMVHLWRFLFWK